MFWEETTVSFSDFSAWGTFMLVAALLGSMLIANVIKKSIPFLQNSLIPTSVLGGILLLIIGTVFKAITGDVLFDTEFFGSNGSANLELITYHTLALGFIASSLKTNKKKMTKKRSVEIFDSGVTTVSTYLLQGVFGMGITMIAALVISDFFPASGLLLPFGYGQGTGQALNYGNIYETDYGFVGGRNFGLTIAAMGFLSASIGGVIHLNVLKHSGKLKKSSSHHVTTFEEVESENEIPMQASIDKLTVQLALIAVAYAVTYAMMFGLSKIIPSMSATIFGFNFLLGVISATLIKLLINFLKKKNIVKKDYTNNFLLTRTSNFFFDIMVVAGIAAIDLNKLEDYWGIVLILGVVGFLTTYVYIRFISKLMFKDYPEEQFLAMYGMLTGTASTGIILLREIDGEFNTPAADNLVYQTLPAIVFGFPLMLLATLAPKKPVLTFIILILFFLVMNLILFRKFIFFRKRLKEEKETAE